MGCFGSTATVYEFNETVKEEYPQKGVDDVNIVEKPPEIVVLEVEKPPDPVINEEEELDIVYEEEEAQLIQEPESIQQEQEPELMQQEQEQEPVKEEAQPVRRIIYEPEPVIKSDIRARDSNKKQTVTLPGIAEVEPVIKPALAQHKSSSSRKSVKFAASETQHTSSEYEAQQEYRLDERRKHRHRKERHRNEVQPVSYQRSPPQRQSQIWGSFTSPRYEQQFAADRSPRHSPREFGPPNAGDYPASPREYQQQYSARSSRSRSPRGSQYPPQNVRRESTGMYYSPSQSYVPQSQYQQQYQQPVRYGAYTERDADLDMWSFRSSGRAYYTGASPQPPLSHGTPFSNSFQNLPQNEPDVWAEARQVYQIRSAQQPQRHKRKESRRRRSRNTEEKRSNSPESDTKPTTSDGADRKAEFLARFAKRYEKPQADVKKVGDELQIKMNPE